MIARGLRAAPAAGGALAVLLWVAGAAQAADPVQVVRAHLEAFNRHDVDALVERVAPDFIWFNVTSDETKVEVQGRDALRASLTSYFKSTPTVRSEMENVTQAGPFVAFLERASWTSKKGERSQSSLAVYEVREEKIVRAWYYPAVP